MVVLRAEREQVWLILGYTPHPTQPTPPLDSRSQAEDGQTLSARQSGTVGIRICKNDE